MSFHDHRLPIIGVDENNFSPSLAGPVVVTALLARTMVAGVTDSKLLSHPQRLALLGPIQEASTYSISLATIPMIREVGIHRARNIAIIQSLIGLTYTVGWDLIDQCRAQVDGTWSPKQLTMLREATGILNITAGKDEEDYAVAAASIVGKVYMDSLFRGFGDFYSGIYGVNFNKGGVSAEHRESLRQYGPSPFHRPRNYGRAWWHSILKETEYD